MAAGAGSPRTNDGPVPEEGEHLEAAQPPLPKVDDRGAAAGALVDSSRALFATGLLFCFALCTCIGLFIYSRADRNGVDHDRDEGPVFASRLPVPTLVAETPRSDSRKYQVVVLENGLQVLNVHDHKASSDAFAVAVDAGSFDNPLHLEGLAHFCEHMVFLGTQSYPDPLGFDNFVQGNGGFANAYTAEEATVYYVELAGGNLDEGLDRFGDFFRAPLFDKHFVDKELHAIDSEHAKNRQDPVARISAVLDSLASPMSPVSRFKTGSLETLSTTPKSQGMETIDELRLWFDTHYCPRRMHLVTFSSLPLEQQLAKAQRHFGNITARSRLCEGQRTSWAQPAAWPQERLGKWVTIAGTQPQAYLLVTFSFPDLTKEYLAHPDSYLKYVLSYGGEQSLLTVLRDELGLISSISAPFSTTSAGGLFSVEFGLAQAGLKQPERILRLFFEHIGRLRSEEVDMDLYRSIADVAKLNWDWSEHSMPSDTVSELAERLTRLPPSRVLSGDSVIEAPDAAFVTSLLRLISPERAIVALVDPAPTFGAQEHVQKLAHYNVEFTVADLEDKFPDLFEATGSPTPSEDDEVEAPQPPRAIPGVPKEVSTEHMALRKEKAKPGEFDSAVSGPAPRPLLTTNGTTGYSLNNTTEEVQATAGDSTVELGAQGGKQDPGAAAALSSQAELWFREGWLVSSPRVRLQAAFRPLQTPDTWEIPAADSVRLQLFSSLLLERLEPKLFDQRAVGSSYEISVGPEGLSLAVDAYEPLLLSLADGVLKGLADMLAPGKSADASSDSSQVQFRRTVQDLNESLRSYSKMPITYAVEDRNTLLTVGTHSRDEELESLNGIDAGLVQATAREFLAGGAVLRPTMLVMGNTDEESARNAIASIERGVANASAGGRVSPPSSEAPSEASSKAPSEAVGAKGEVLHVDPVVQPGRPVELRRWNPRANDPNDVVVVSLLYGVATVQSRVVLGILGKIAGSVAFNELRTKRQLGYIVNSGDVMISNVHAISTAVQGTALSADRMEAAVEWLYFSEIPKFLDDMTDEQFASFRHGFKQNLLQPAQGHEEEFRHFWGSLLVDPSCISLRDEMMWFLEEHVTSKRLLVEAWTRLILPEKAARQKVVVKYFSTSPSSPESRPKGGAAPERPSDNETEEMWRSEGLPGEGLRQLTLERGNTTVLFGAASAALRRELAKEGSFYAHHVHCEIPADMHSPIKPTKASREATTDALATAEALEHPAAFADASAAHGDGADGADGAGDHDEVLAARPGAARVRRGGVGGASGAAFLGPG